LVNSDNILESFQRITLRFRSPYILLSSFFTGLHKWEYIFIFGWQQVGPASQASYCTETCRNPSIGRSKS